MGGLDFLTEPFEKVFDWWKENVTEPVLDFLKEDVLGIKTPEQEKRSARGVQINSSGNNEPIPVVFGRRRIGGVRTFVGVSGEQNQYLWIELTLCEGEIEEIENVYIDDENITAPRFAGLITTWKYTGTNTQTANADLIAAFPTLYSVNHRSLGVAKILVRLLYNEGVFSSLPRITVDIKGQKLFDPRTSTTIYSANPALCIYALLTNTRWGKGLNPNQLNTQTFIDAADYCDTPMETYGGSGVNIPLFALNGVMNTEDEIKQNLELLLKNCGGFLSRIGGKYQLIIEKDDAPVFDLNPDNIIDAPVSIVGVGKQARLNRARVRYISEVKNWQDDLQVAEFSGFLIQDRNVVLETEIKQDFETDEYRAIFKAQTALKKSRQGIGVGLTATLDAINVTAGDIVTITYPSVGWAAKLFRVLTVRILANATIAMALIEHEPLVYNRSIPASQPTPPDTNLPNPFVTQPPTALMATSGNSVLIIGADGTIISRIKLSWAASADVFVTHYEIRYKNNNSTEYEWAPPAIGQAANSTLITGVKDGETYTLQVRAVNNRQIKSEFVTIGHLVQGKTEPPPRVNAFSVRQQGDGTREFVWDYPNPPPDFAGFKIRYFQGTSTNWDEMTPLHEGLIVASPWENNFLLSGSYTFAIRAVDTSGNESIDRFTAADLSDPRLGDSIVYVQPAAQNWPGIKTDCYRENGNGWLVAENDGDWTDLTTWAAWTTYATNPKAQIKYEHITIDIGSVIKFKAVIAASVNGTISLREINYSTDDVTYSGWITATGQEVEARYIKIRITVDATLLKPWPAIKDMAINLSGRLIEYFINDLDISTLTGANRIAAGHVKLPVPGQNFALFKTVVIIPQNVGSGYTYELISKSDLTNGPEIKIYNGAGTLTDITLDALIKGV